MKRFLTLAGVLGVLACGGSDSTAPDPSKAVVGNYVLTQLNGAATPMIYSEDANGKIEVLGGTMALRSDHTYNQTIDVRVTYTDGTPTRTTTVPEDGTYTANSQQIIFTIPASPAGPAVSYAGEVSGSVVTYTYDADKYRFEKQ